MAHEDILWHGSLVSSLVTFLSELTLMLYTAQFSPTLSLTCQTHILRMRVLYLQKSAY